MRTFPIQPQLTAEQKASARRKLGLSWAGYWILFFAMLVGAGEYGASSQIGGGLVLAFLVAWGYLVATVADCASRLGKSSIAWGGGVVVLGPLGALLLPGLIQIELKR